MSKELQEALMGLYDLVWNEVAIYDSDIDGYGLIGWDDNTKLDDQCLKIERLIIAERNEVAS